MIGNEDSPTTLSGIALAEALAAVPGPFALLIGESPPSEAEVGAMTRLLEAGGFVARAVPVTDALKAVEGGVIAGTIDRESTVVLRLPVLASTVALRAIAAEAGDDEIDLIEALAEVAAATVFTRS
jgi:2-C-methyl-D-erythritol 4-phosphate cytidylyltransferase